MQAMSQAAIRKRLPEEEAQDLQQHADQSLHLDIFPLILISSGVDIEGQQ